jgi:hypothetical protein
LEGGIVVAVIRLSERLKNWFAGLKDCPSFRPEVGLGDVEEVGLGDVEEVGLGDVEEVGLGDVEEVGLGIEMTTAGPETENAFDMN